MFVLVTFVVKTLNFYFFFQCDYCIEIFITFNRVIMNYNRINTRKYSSAIVLVLPYIF